MLLILKRINRKKHFDLTDENKGSVITTINYFITGNPLSFPWQEFQKIQAKEKIGLPKFLVMAPTRAIERVKIVNLYILNEK